MKFNSLLDLISMRNISLLSLFALIGCEAHTPIRTETKVDLERFMGDWYVIANIPTFIEKGAHNAVESYSLNEDGTINTVFTFNKDNFNGKKKTYNPTGYVFDTDSNAVWGMQFIWPIKAEYRIIYLSEDYSETIIGRTKRDYVWIMARTHEISNDKYSRLLNILKEEGYDLDKIEKVPQNWSSR